MKHWYSSVLPTNTPVPSKMEAMLKAKLRTLFFNRKPRHIVMLDLRGQARHYIV